VKGANEARSKMIGYWLGSSAPVCFCSGERSFATCSAVATFVVPTNRLSPFGLVMYHDLGARTKRQMRFRSSGGSWSSGDSVAFLL
jgi:hypothetical protein